MFLFYFQGEVNCWAKDIKYKSKFANQDRKNNVIMKQNKAMLKKICQVTTQYPARELFKDLKKMHQVKKQHAISSN